MQCLYAGAKIERGFEEQKLLIRHLTAFLLRLFLAQDLHFHLGQAPVKVAKFGGSSPGKVHQAGIPVVEPVIYLDYNSSAITKVRDFYPCA